MEQREETAQAMAWHDGDTRKILEMLQQDSPELVKLLEYLVFQLLTP